MRENFSIFPESDVTYAKFDGALCIFLGLLVRKSRAGRVYSPICSRKKNVMIARSPTAWSRGLLLCCAVANMWIGTDTGMAS